MTDLIPRLRVDGMTLPSAVLRELEKRLLG